MKFITAVLLAFMVSICAFADEQPADQLHQLVSLPNIRQKPLKDVLADIVSQANLPVTYESKAIRNEGISLDTKVSANLPSISAGEALKLLLQSNGLDYEVQEHSIVISTPGALASRWKEVSYPVSDLIGGRDGEMISHPDFAALTDLITSIVPNSWEQSYGRGQISVDADTQSLTIHQAAAVHRQITDLLAQLRKMRVEGMAKQIARHAVNIDAAGEKLSNIVSDISKQCGLNICLEPDCGDPVVSLTAHNITAEDALTKIVSQLNLRKKYANESVVIYADTKFFLTTYPVGDLLTPAGGRNLDSVVDQVKTAIDPGHWNGSDSSASIDGYSINNSLVVCQNEAGQEQVKAFLEKLRHSN